MRHRKKASGGKRKNKGFHLVAINLFKTKKCFKTLCFLLGYTRILKHFIGSVLKVYSTVTDLARLRGLSTSSPLAIPV